MMQPSQSEFYHKNAVHLIFFQIVMIGEWHIMSTNGTQNTFSTK